MQRVLLEQSSNELANHETWSHYSNFDGAYSEIADLIVALII